MPEMNPATGPSSDAQIEREIQRLTRRSFALGAAGAMAGLAGWIWLRTAGREGGLPWPLRRTLELNERLAEACFSSARLAPTFPREQAREPRFNGMIGLMKKFDVLAGGDELPENFRLRDAEPHWSLHVENLSAAPSAFTLSLADIKGLPRTEMVTQLHCVEGWSVVVQWAGVRLSDFASHYKLGTRNSGRLAQNGDADLMQYVGFKTPDGKYYVGFDAQSAYHPQTLLAYEMNGQPLAVGHGAPLRLITAVKYGYKSLKWLGTITFTDRRPADFWAERGYDWYAGH
jgi:DMSO/TMAO reductase YedYZ molybdopterin-dependent catalytic subunit